MDNEAVFVFAPRHPVVLRADVLARNIACTVRGAVHVALRGAIVIPIPAPTTCMIVVQCEASCVGSVLTNLPPPEQQALPNEGHIVAALEWAEPDANAEAGSGMRKAATASGPPAVARM